MDRRRFVPSPEGLEGRALLSTVNPGIVPPAQAPSPVVGVPNSPEQKTLRIERLPAFLRGIQEDRFLPDEAVAPLQADLGSIRGKLHSPPGAVLEQFNRAIRDVIPENTLSEEDARLLNRAFGSALRAAGASPEAEASLMADMNGLARIDANDVNPVILATNDYAIVLQTALGVGRPIRTPTLPTLATVDAIGGQGSRVTANRQPHLVGTYDPGATIQLLDDNGSVIGSADVDPSGRYNVAIAVPLAEGTHAVRARAVNQDEISGISPPYTFRVVIAPPRPLINATPPAGPLGR